MIKSKNLYIISSLAIVFALIISFIILALPESAIAKTVNTTEYETEIFGEDIISIEILADENTWQYMLDNSTLEEYIMVDIIVNGVKFTNVGIRPKGNSSLRFVANSNSDRYSFRIKFDEYIDGQTCFGLDTFVVNNMYKDNTYMKEYLSYEIMHEIGVEAPCFSYATLSVNGNSCGLYLAVEYYNSSYEKRVYDDSSGCLYTVKMSGGSGGSLEYTDNNSSSYSAIFSNVVGDGSEENYQKVITAIRELNEGADIESYWNVDEILRYFAAHNFVVNLDSYSSTTTQNYFIYENDGIISILPWDYNEAWGNFRINSASDAINFPIDTPISGVQMSERPLIEKLFENSKYLDTYHQYLQELIENYSVDGKFEEKIEEIDGLINDYVKNDPTSFCTYDEYKKGISTLIEFGELRTESVQGQLNGTVPSTTQEQSKNQNDLISGQNINLSDLGSTTGGEIKDNTKDNVKDNFNNDRMPPDNMPDETIMQQAMQILQKAEGNITKDVKTALKELGLNDEQITMLSSTEPGNRPQGGQQGGVRDDMIPQNPINQDINRNNIKPDNTQDIQEEKTNESSNNLLLTGILLGVLALGILGVSKYKKKY